MGGFLKDPACSSSTLHGIAAVQKRLASGTLLRGCSAASTFYPPNASHQTAAQPFSRALEP